MSRDVRRWFVPVALALLVALAGCSGGAGDAAKTVASGAPTEAEQRQTAAADSGDPGFQGENAAVAERALIRTGTVSLRVDDHDAARRNLSRATRRLGGFVSDSSERVHADGNRSWTTGKLVLRVPKENFSALVARAKRAGKVQKASTSTKDVTKQLVDVEARLTNLRAQRDRLRELYRNANDTENVLEVQERLSEVQSEIEQLEARRKALKRQVAYSTLTVRLNESPPDREPPEDEKHWYETGLLAAFASSIHGVEVVLRSLAVALAYAAPFVLAFGVPVGSGYAFWKRRQNDDADGIDLPNVPESGEDSDPSGEDGDE